MKFTLEIELGNEAMRISLDVARAVECALFTFRESPRFLEVPEEGMIRDANANTVGKWEVTQTPAEAAAEGQPYKDADGIWHNLEL